MTNVLIINGQRHEVAVEVTTPRTVTITNRPSQSFATALEAQAAKERHAMGWRDVAGGAVFCLLLLLVIVSVAGCGPF